MKRIVSPELIRDYLAGKCTPEQALLVRQWYDSFDNDTDPLDALAPRERAALKEAMYKEVLQRFQAQQELPPQPRRKLFALRRKHFALAGAAAAVLLFLGLSLIFDRPDPEVAALCAATETGKPAALPHPEAKAIKIENTHRSIRREVLPDGSVVWLQPDTWITFSSVFEEAFREVHMSGEAFFEVSPDASRPFIVYSGDLVTRVLGTSFNIKAYKDDASAEVSVFTGQVAVSLPVSLEKAGDMKQGNNELLLVKDEKAIFLQREKLLKKKVYNVKKEPELNIWEKNTVSFDNTPVKEVVKVLNKEFGVSLRVYDADPQLNDYLLKADFTNQNLPDILEMLEKSLGLTYEIQGKKIVLRLDN